MRTIALFLALALAPAAAADWPQFRGPQRDGVCRETGLISGWPAAGPRLLWMATDLGTGYSAPSVVGDRVYIAGDLTDGAYLFCLKRSDASVLWRSPIGKPDRAHRTPGTKSTPTVVGADAAIISMSGELVVIDAASGTQRWRADLRAGLGGKTPARWAESPLIDGDQIVCAPGGAGGSLAAFDRATGRPRWRSAGFTDTPHYSSTVLATLAGQPQYVHATEQAVVGVAPDGRVLWSAPRPLGKNVSATPVASGDLVFVNTGYSGGGCQCFKIARSGDAWTATLLYESKEMNNIHAGAVLLDGHLYGSGNDGLACIDMRTGARRWASRQAPTPCSLIHADGHLWCRSQGKEGILVLVEANPARYVEKARFAQPQRSPHDVHTHPVIAYGTLFLRDCDRLFAYDVTAR